MTRDTLRTIVPVHGSRNLRTGTLRGILYLSVECFGGRCLYGGYACRNGEVLLREPMREDDDFGASESALKRLLGFLGVKLGDEAIYFEPLTRGYFDGL